MPQEYTYAPQKSQVFCVRDTFDPLIHYLKY